jgi:hypothetical protein
MASSSERFALSSFRTISSRRANECSKSGFFEGSGFFAGVGFTGVISIAGNPRKNKSIARTPFPRSQALPTIIAGRDNRAQDEGSILMHPQELKQPLCEGRGLRCEAATWPRR